MNHHQQMLTFHGLLGALAIGLCLACAYLVVGDEPVHAGPVPAARSIALIDSPANNVRPPAPSQLHATALVEDELAERATRFLKAYAEAEAARIQNVAHHAGQAQPAHRPAVVPGATEAALPAGARGEAGNRHRLIVPGRLAPARVITRRTARTPSNPAVVKVEIGDMTTYENLLRPIGLRSDGEVHLDPGHSLFRLRSLAGVTTSELAAASVERQRIRNAAPRGNRAQIVRLARLGGKNARKQAVIHPAGREQQNPNIIGPQRRHDTPRVPKSPAPPARAIARAT